jgi:uncharacterized membrane protein (GlpM family)
MVFMYLAIKAAAAGAIVLGLSLLAERVKPKIAGIIAGAPLGALISFYMLGIEQGPAFVIASVPHAIAGMSGVLVFIAAYHQTSLRAQRLNALVSTFAGLLGYLVVALALERIRFTVITALPVAIAVAVVVGYLFRRTEDVRIARPARLTLGLLVVRAGGAAFFVVSAVALAKALGPGWAGVLMGFPLTLLPTMLIVHLTYSREHVYVMLQGFPIGIGSVLTYLITVPWSFGTLGVHLGTAVALAAAWAYLVGLSLFYGWMRRR